MKVSIIIPAHNEGENLEKLMEHLITTLERRIETEDYEIIIVDDNSTDDTGKVADTLSQKNNRITVIHRKERLGFGNAVKTGLKRASGDVVIPVMGDLSDDPEDIPKLVRGIEEGYDIAYGSRFIRGGRVEGYSPLKMICNRSFNNLVRLLFGIKHKDITNAFKAYRKKVLDVVGIDSLKSKGFDLTVEIPLRAHLLGFSSVEVPVTWHGRERGASKLKLSRNGPLYGKRLLKMFILKNIIEVQKILARRSNNE